MITSINLGSLSTPSQGIKLTSTGPGAQDSVNIIKDINGDGIDEIAIGSDSEQQSPFTGGGAWIVFGGTSLTNIALESITSSQGFYIYGTTTNANLGNWVSSAGDINGDGYNDVLVCTNNPPGVGTVSVLFGGQSSYTNLNMNSIPASKGFTISGISGTRFGNAASAAGDVNGDGIDDIIVGANYPSSAAGTSYVIYGRHSFKSFSMSSFNSSYGFSITGATANDMNGNAVSGAGDVNGDGYSDVVTGAFQALSNKGITYVIYGGPTSSLSNINLATLSASRGFSITGASTGDSIGWSVSTAGDFNKDGYSDIVIGAQGVSSSAGAAYVIYGGSTSSLSNINLATLSASRGISIGGTTSVSKYLGSAVSDAGDINNDGYGDIYIGGQGNVGTNCYSYAVYGGHSLSNINLNSPDSSLFFPIYYSSNTFLGGYISGKGDVNGDGIPDLLIESQLAVGSGGVNFLVYGTGTPRPKPTRAPTQSPTFTVTYSPTVVPSALPTKFPTIAPSAIPTAKPTVVPSAVPTAEPTVVPTDIPTVVPSAIPTAEPTVVPTDIPTVVPSAVPTAEPTVVPTDIPTVVPSAIPTAEPTVVPTDIPTVVPSAVPTAEPTVVPTDIPTSVPSGVPTELPTSHPTAIPTNLPTSAPSVEPIECFNALNHQLVNISDVCGHNTERRMTEVSEFVMEQTTHSVEESEVSNTCYYSSFSAAAISSAVTAIALLGVNYYLSYTGFDKVVELDSTAIV